MYKFTLIHSGDEKSVSSLNPFLFSSLHFFTTSHHHTAHRIFSIFFLGNEDKSFRLLSQKIPLEDVYTDIIAF